jgi:thioredoxin reductase (NADPH)
MEQTNQYDVIVLGGGAAGLTAGIYLSRAKVSTLILNEGMVGGQMILTYEIANYPGIEKTTGYQLSMTMKKQAESFGCDIKQNVQIQSIELEGKTKKISLANGDTFESKAVIIASGGSSRNLNVEGENEFKGRGISYCATCDGDFYTGQDIIVVGGGNSALEEAVSLTKFAKSVTIVHQFDYFQAFEHAVEVAKSNDKISFILDSTIDGFYGDEKLKYVNIRNIKTGEITKKEIDGVFIFIGYAANSSKFKHLVALNKYGEIPTDEQMKTNIDGVFAAGDVREKTIRQITTAVSDGAISAVSAIEYVQQ